MVEQLVQHIESRLLEWWRGKEVREAELRDLRDEIARQQERIVAAVERKQALAARVRANEEIAAALPAQVESSFRRGKASQALRQALELDRVRRELDADRADLPRLAQACWSMSFRLRQLRRQLARALAGPAGK